MTSKQRAYLKSLASVLEPVLSLGKETLTPEFTEAVRETFNTRELIKINVLKTCDLDINEIAIEISRVTHSELVQKIGRTLVFYKKAKEPKIII